MDSPPAAEVLNIGTPSITNSAPLLLRSIDDSPRSVTRIEPPPPVLALATERPATWPERPDIQLDDEADDEKTSPLTFVAA